MSGDRGEVRRVCRGSYELLGRNSQAWTIRLSSVALTGEFELRRIEGERWLMRKVPS